MKDDKGLKASERRRHSRIRKDLKIRFGALWSLAKSPSFDHEGDVIDVGGGGVRFVTSEPVSQGAQLILALGFPGWISDEDEWVESQDTSNIGVLKVIGEVVRVVPITTSEGRYDVAIRFSGRIRM